MTHTQTQISEIRYNAADQCFEALVTFHTTNGRVRIASTYEGPISASFEQASDGLWRNALHQIDAPRALRARLQAKRAEPARIVPNKSPFQRLSEVFLPTAA